MKHFDKKILFAVSSCVLLLVCGTLLAFLLLSDAFKRAPVTEIFPENTYTETLTAVTDIDYEPFSYVDENGNYAGLDVELIAEIANCLEMNLDLTLTDWTEANDLFFGGQADVFLNMETDLIAGDDRMIATLPTAEKQYVVYGRETVASVPELYGRRVVSLHRLPELGLPDITYYDSYAEIFEALADGAFDFAICPIQVGNVFLEKMQLADVEPSYAVSHIYGAIALSSGNTELKERMDSVISDLEREGFLDALDRKWVSNRYQSMTLSGMVRSHPMVGAGFFAGLLLLILLFFFLLVLQRRNEELRLAKEKAEESANAKTTFLSNMSHEIRTPINAVLGMNEMILREAADNETISSYAANVESAGRNLLSIINDVLDFSKIDAGKMEVLPAPYKLSSVLNDVTNIAVFRARDKGLSFDVTVDETLPDALHGDEVRIRQILTNVLGNAVKYTKEGGVSLDVTADERTTDTLRLKFAIRDTGIGIREEDIGRLFDQFERMELKKNKTIEGTGLGLAITKSLLDLMDGTIAVESTYGEGSTFTIELPQKILSPEAIGDFHEKFAHALKERPAYHALFTAPDATILVVDDTDMNLTVVKGLLAKTKVRIDTASGGEEALQLTKEKTYDLILMDQMMPVMDGSEVLKHLRAQTDGANRETPVLCLTADAVSGARDRYLSEGFDGYLSKPVDGKALEEALQTYLPADKILAAEAGDPDMEDADSSGKQTPSALFRFYENTPALQYAEAVTSCANEEILSKTLEQFYGSIDKNAEAITTFLKEENLRDYTIKVHALKSSARLIGALSLSDHAMRLEACSKEGGDENREIIARKTPDLLRDYLALKETLASYYEKETPADDKDKPLLTEDELSALCEKIREAAEDFDSDTIDDLIAEADTFRLPESAADTFKQIKEAASEMDWEKLEQLLSPES